MRGDYSVWMDRLWDRDSVGITLIRGRTKDEREILTNAGEWRPHRPFERVDASDLPSFSIPGLAVDDFCAGVLNFMERNNIKTPDAPVNATLREERDWLRGHFDRIINTMGDRLIPDRSGR